MAKKKASAGSAVQRIRVKDGVMSPEFPDVPLAGWSGTVVETSGKPPEEQYVIEWDAATISAMPADYVRRCEAQQLYHLMAQLPASSVEPAA